jgi:mRNA-degrading endonuclease RelE of RelBE toxin-antitoxin system
MADRAGRHTRERSVEQSTRFGKVKRRMPAKAQLLLDEEVKKLMADPLSGEPRRGALKGIRMVKFKVSSQLLLLAYEFNDRRNVIELLDVGPHENFYKDLQGHIDARPR